MPTSPLCSNDRLFSGVTNSSSVVPQNGGALSYKSITPGVGRGSLGRAARLRAHTRALHGRLDELIMGYRPLQDRRRYKQFLDVQVFFLRHMEHVYADTRLNTLIRGLSGRSRLGLIEQDFIDLGLASEPPPPITQALSGAESLGWLYVAEGSTLGAAVLIKQARALGFDACFGARHLAGHSDARGLQWRQFLAEFDVIVLSDTQEREAEQGAANAFRFVRDRATAIFNQDPDTGSKAQFRRPSPVRQGNVNV